MKHWIQSIDQHADEGVVRVRPPPLRPCFGMCRGEAGQPQPLVAGVCPVGGWVIAPEPSARVPQPSSYSSFLFSAASHIFFTFLKAQ